MQDFNLWLGSDLPSMTLVKDWALCLSLVSVSKNPLFINSAVIFSIFKHENDDSSASTLLRYKFSSQNRMFCSMLRFFWILYLFQFDSLIYASLITFFMISCFNKCWFIYWFDTFIEKRHFNSAHNINHNSSYEFFVAIFIPPSLWDISQ